MNSLKKDIEFLKTLLTQLSDHNSQDDTRFDSVMTQVSSFEYPIDNVHHLMNYRLIHIFSIAACFLLVFAFGYYFGKAKNHLDQDTAVIPTLSQNTLKTVSNAETYSTLFSSLQIFQSDNTIIENILTNQGHHRIFLKKGKLSLQFLPRLTNETVEIVTDKGSIHVIGTIFSVEVKDTLHVSVAKGSVKVTTNNKDHIVLADQTLENDTIQILTEEEKRQLIKKFDPIDISQKENEPIKKIPQKKELSFSKENTSINRAAMPINHINIESLYQTAEQKIQSKDYQTAVKIFAQIIDSNADHILIENAYAELIRIYEKFLTDTPLCLQYIEQYLTQFPQGIFVLELKLKHCMLSKTFDPITPSAYCKKN